METKNIVDVENFVVECNDILTGKFFDLNRRLQKFLNIMSQSEDVLEFLADALVDFDENAELAKAFSFDRKTGAVKISLPNDEKKRMALSLTLFDNFANGKVNSNQFLETFFQDNKITPIQNFLEKIIRPFRDIICKNFEISSDVSALDIKKHEQELLRLAEQEEAQKHEQEQEEVKEEKDAHLDALFHEIMKSCQQILTLVSFEKKHLDFFDDVEFVTSAIIRACEIGDLMVINGLVIGLSSVAKKFKNAHHIIDDMKNLILNYYDFLSEGIENSSEDIQNGDEDD